LIRWIPAGHGVTWDTLEPCDPVGNPLRFVPRGYSDTSGCVISIRAATRRVLRTAQNSTLCLHSCLPKYTYIYNCLAVVCQQLAFHQRRLLPDTPRKNVLNRGNICYVMHFSTVLVASVTVCAILTCLVDASPMSLSVHSLGVRPVGLKNRNITVRPVSLPRRNVAVRPISLSSCYFTDNEYVCCLRPTDY
jgi:hypothetical protein